LTTTPPRFAAAHDTIRRISDPAIKARALAAVTEGQLLCGVGSPADFDATIALAAAAGSPDEAVRALTEIALAQHRAGGASEATLATARDVLAIDADRFTYGPVELELALAQMHPDLGGHFGLAKQRATAIANPKTRDEVFSRIARVEARLGRFDEALLTAELLQSSVERIHTDCEIALIQRESGVNAQPTVDRAIKLAAELTTKAQQIEAYCYVCVASGLLGKPANYLTNAVQDVAESLTDPVEIDAAHCQIVATKAQLGRLEDAELRAGRIDRQSFKDSAWKTIAVEYARRGEFDEAQRVLDQIEGVWFRDLTLKELAIQQVETGQGKLLVK
jgi:tetratricopeptide (TPR) repeat protein